MENKDFRSVDSNTRKEIRKLAMKQIASGIRKKIVAEMYGVNPNTISSWVKKYALDGTKGLTDNKRGVKSEDKKLLNNKQEQDIQNMITDVMPDQLKLDYALWTRKAVKELVERKLGIFKTSNEHKTSGEQRKVLGDTHTDTEKYNSVTGKKDTSWGKLKVSGPKHDPSMKDIQNPSK